MKYLKDMANLPRLVTKQKVLPIVRNYFSSNTIFLKIVLFYTLADFLSLRIDLVYDSQGLLIWFRNSCD